MKKNFAFLSIVICIICCFAMIIMVACDDNLKPLDGVTKQSVNSMDELRVYLGDEYLLPSNTNATGIIALSSQEFPNSVQNFTAIDSCTWKDFFYEARFNVSFFKDYENLEERIENYNANTYIYRKIEMTDLAIFYDTIGESYIFLAYNSAYFIKTLYLPDGISNDEIIINYINTFD